MSFTLSQANRALRTTQSPLGPDVLIPVAFTGQESVSKLFTFHVEFVSTTATVTAADVLGKPIGLVVELPGGKKRHIHGIVSRFRQLGSHTEFSRYSAELVPAAWRLTLASNSRTFEKMTVPEIVEKVIKGSGVSDFSPRLMGAFPKQEFVVQYRETDFAFVTRLLESVGIYYWFEHEASKHSWVLSNATGTSIPAGILPSVRVGLGDPGTRPGIDSVTELAREFRMHSSKVELFDHALLRPDLTHNAPSRTDHQASAGRVFDFLGDLALADMGEMQAVTKREMQRREVDYELLTGGSTCAAFTAGTRVKLAGGIAGTGVEVMLLRVEHDFQQGDIMAGGGEEAAYRNMFTALAASTPYLPPADTAWPSVQGTQTAKIVGSGGDGEIDVDADGRVLLQFPWDREGAGATAKSEHRVHVASVWAGAGWGFVQHPRVGQEVLVEFLEGDPNRPIVTGRVYNAQNKYPWALPANKTQSGVKTRSVGGGAANCNELRFEDKKGSEQVLLHAEKNMDTEVENDETHWVGHDRKTTIDNEDTRTVKKGNDTHTIEKGDHKFMVKAGAMTIEVEKDHTTTVKSGNRVTKIEKGNETVKVSVGNMEITVDAGNVKIKASAGKIELDAAQSILLKCGASTMELKPAEIAMKSVQVKGEGQAKMELKGAMTKLEGTGKVDVKGAMISIEGDAMTTLKGAMAQVTGSAMLKAGGGITMIG